MATNPATTKQLKFLEQLTGKDYSGEELTASEASKKIEKALANKGKEVAELPEQSSQEMLDEHKDVIDKARESVSFDPTRKSIERQKSLDIAERWCSLKVQGGADIKTAELITVAGLFESYLENGIQVKKK